MLDGYDWLGHGMSIGALLGVLAGVFTPFAALVTGLWFTVQLYESKTVQNWVRHRRERRIAKLKMLLGELEGVQEE